MVALVIAARRGGGRAACNGSGVGEAGAALANSIAVIDAKSGKPVGDVPLGFSPTDVNASGNEIWVLNWLRPNATAIDPSTLKVIQTVGVDGDPRSQYADRGHRLGGHPGRRRCDSTRRPTATTRSRSHSGSRPAVPLDAYVYVTGNGRTVWVSEGTNVAVIDARAGTSSASCISRPRAASPRASPATASATRTACCLRSAARTSRSGRSTFGSASYTPIATEPSSHPGKLRGRLRKLGRRLRLVLGRHLDNY